VRPQARYARSLELLARAATWARGAASASSAGGPESAPAPAPVGFTLARPLVKSGLMVGLGERTAEVEEVLRDCAAAGVDAVTIGQYLQPHAACLPVVRYVAPTEFASHEKRGAALGLQVAAAPFVRSSYRAGELLGRPAGGGSRS